MELLKKFWALIVLAVAAVVGLLALVLGRKTDKTIAVPARPGLPDVKIPDVNTAPADDYARDRGPVTRDPGAVVNEINARHG